MFHFNLFGKLYFPKSNKNVSWISEKTAFYIKNKEKYKLFFKKKFTPEVDFVFY